MVDWNYDTVRKIAKMLTVDKNGKDATQAGFDPKNIVQCGFEPQRDDLRGSAPTGGRQLRRRRRQDRPDPDAWAAAWKWFYDGIWTDHFIDDRAAVPEHRTSTRTATRSSPARSR